MMSIIRRKLMMASCHTVQPSDGWIYLKKNFQATEKFEESILQDGISEFEISFKNVVYSGGNQCIISIGDDIKIWEPKGQGYMNMHLYCIGKDAFRIQITGAAMGFAQKNLSRVNIQDDHIIKFDGTKLLFDDAYLDGWSRPGLVDAWLERIKTDKNLKVGSMEGKPNPNVFFNYIKYK